MKHFMIGSCIALTCSLAQGQPAAPKWDLKADFALINRCAHAARVVVKSIELYPLSKQSRERFLETVVRQLRETNQLGEQTPSDVNLFFAKVDDMLTGDIDLKDPASREWLTSQSAAACTLHSSRTNP